MKIALMTNNYKPFMGGVPISVERLKNGLECLGHEVTVFAPTYPKQEEENQQGCKECHDIFRYKTLLPKFIGGIVLPNPFDKRIEEEFQKNHYDIIHVHHPILIGHTAVYLSRKYGIPLVFTYHTRYEQYLFSYVKAIKKMDSVLHGGIQNKLFPLYLKTFFGHCNHIFAPTHGMKIYLQEICGVDENKVSVLPTGIESCFYHVEEEKTQEIRKRYRAENIPLLLSVSRMANEKNVEFLLRGIAKVKEQYSGRFRVLLVGEGPDRENYEKLSRELQIDEEVIFTGQVPNEEIAPYFAAADAFVFASKTETQGIVILEAFAGKTPVYALKASGVSDLVRDGANGRLCEEDVDAFAGQLLPLLEGKEDMERLIHNAYETALAYKEECIAERAIRQYNRVVMAKNDEYQESSVLLREKRV